ncbi:MAG: 4-hydroxythreonine-4-phosphate dehydrogenase PdxA [Nitrosomonas sp.]|uniref:4-hydroxythreonine-4-phosphate dehydrogenase PdxA n=1 Tax=Nitrosomonas sp. TaxID=42353 RepID=UPI00272FD675|nr:4-hydroxythreonine-4-phosphate dehydrogenase PdxA [Nitrosomonas sp.]MBK6958586.1 4-hydroxythreonine-4-phosphate dehydrogenase PdxA [Nitrosomonas sp.]MDP1548910.1 4-hydroxythreonine-4-phosphate dehydrogenase PdxA [Nitrosomonas sp.]MDP3664890.1 4-hydroxythreonine-4-phosphate dehydrogenase PdxA [Nitrosomonas sp.]MDZ4104943.1 4-hydroxythreonine-4-phosphate dehydrogenase PdxA [Nitrosomonas sp.]
MNNKFIPRLALTAGEPAGIGPDICVQIAQQPLSCNLVVIADRELLRIRAQQLKLPLKLIDISVTTPCQHTAGSLQVLHVPLAETVIPGTLNPANARYVLSTLERAVEVCRSGEFDGMVTAPVHKGVINDAGIPFTGHTEFLAELTHSAVVMMLVGGNMRVTLATTHLPLKDVAAAITPDRIESKLRIIQRDLITRFMLDNPRIVVAGLNPHAGESGHLGREEIDVIIPVLNKLRAEGMQLIGPVPADTLFSPAQLKQYDCIFTMYHDQGLPVLKHASFGGGVNVTLGLPIIRTSVDHGTALELAATGRANPGSLLTAIEMAAQLTKNQALFLHAP